MKTSGEIRETFLRFFEERGHRRVRSSPLVPKNDPTLLFTNAGMNQFKDVFLGIEKRDYDRAVSSQKCMRVSGKHNDLETVGRTPRHHTFFEMLGNFSFGDYFKKKAIEFAWELCTEVYGLEKKLLIATVYEEDDEAWELWRRHMGLPEQQVRRCGASENFWAMGETGPCGPCSELHYDMGKRIGDTESDLEEESDRWVEIWNLVFMQFDRDASGKMTPLPSPSIDTGMGLERITSVLQGVTSNYETDLFKPIIEEAARLTESQIGDTPETDTSLRILSDHARACAFLISDGVVPGNEGRGYVLRKILRRAVRHGKMLGKKDPFLYTLTALVADLMADAYPEVNQSREYAATIVKNEEEKFSSTLNHGTGLLEELFSAAEKAGSKRLEGKELFRLYDTYGFPLDLTREIAEERGFELDEAGFQEALEEQRRRARASWKTGTDRVEEIYRELAERDLETEFVGYGRLEDVQGRVLALVQDGREIESLDEGTSGEVVLDRTPFYAEAGGQVADQGRIENDSFEARVQGVYSPVSGLRLHRVAVTQGNLKVGDSVISRVDRKLRIPTQANHTATHLLHAALREVLGEHVKQAGSLVAPDRLRFDFTHYKPVTESELLEIEAMVNEKIRENIALQVEIQNLEDALEEGAMALFGEKYGDRVRVVKIPGFSVELCGGTHVRRTGDISLFKVVSEGSVSAGVRRIEAITGQDAMQRFFADEQILSRIADELNTRRENLEEAIKRLSADLKAKSRDLERLRLKLATQQTGEVSDQARDIKGVKVLTRRIENVDRNALRQLAGQLLKNQLQSGVVVLGAPLNGRVSLVAMVSEDLTSRIQANELIRSLAPMVGGGGGGKADMAEAGGKDAASLDQALEAAYRLVEEALG